MLQLLVAGQSDREIAEALFTCPRTVQSHVASIFTKLGVNSRTAAATLAVTSGLIADLSAHPAADQSRQDNYPRQGGAGRAGQCPH